MKITHKIIGLVALLGLAGCGTYVPAPTSAELLKTLRQQKMSFNFVDFDTFCNDIARWEKIVGYTQSDKAIVKKILRLKLKFNRRDAELIVLDSNRWGTGMTYRGLDCSVLISSVSKAFYQYSGHHWQVEVGGSYVYLEGDGTPTGMKVTAWN